MEVNMDHQLKQTFLFTQHSPIWQPHVSGLGPHRIACPCPCLTYLRQVQWRKQVPLISPLWKLPSLTRKQYSSMKLILTYIDLYWLILKTYTANHFRLRVEQPIFVHPTLTDMALPDQPGLGPHHIIVKICQWLQSTPEDIWLNNLSYKNNCFLI